MALVTWNEQTRALFKAVNPIDTFNLYAITTATAAVTFDSLANSSNWLELESPTRNFDSATAKDISRAA